MAPSSNKQLPPTSSSSSSTSSVYTPTSSNESAASHASAACSNYSIKANERWVPSGQLLAYLAEPSSPSPYADGPLNGRFSGQPHTADAHDRIEVHTERAREAIDRFDQRFGPV